jgi:DNA-binding NarL/FixJ family response regulator
MVRVLVADPFAMVRRGVKRLVEDRPGWELCAEASNGQEALALALETRPDVAVIEVCLPIMGGLELAQRLRCEAPQTGVLLHTTLDDDATISAALAVGARGYVLKAEGVQHLESAVSALAARKRYFSPRTSELMCDASMIGGGSRLDTFAPREREVAGLVVEGHGNKAIAGLLGLSVKTVESHRGAAMRKSGSRSAIALVHFAVKHDLVMR